MYNFNKEAVNFLIFYTQTIASPLFHTLRKFFLILASCFVSSFNPSSLIQPLPLPLPLPFNPDLSPQPVIDAAGGGGWRGG